MKNININKENIFYKNRSAIAAISRERNVDMGVATSMWAAENNVKDIGAQNEWQSLMTQYQRHPKLTLADLLA